MDPLPSAPPVVVVVVTTDPGDWFEDCLASVAAQDYPNLSILVVDTASTVDPTPRVAAVLPRAYVRRLPERSGFGTAGNEVLDVVEGASHYLFCHDDVAFAPDAVRLLVEEAFRSNAGLATPKMVTWADSERLLCVGMGADRYGTVLPLLEAGELDQAQHDSVRDVFVAPSGATLVRADLFETLGGFAADLDQFGEDLDLSWRTRLAGGRVVAVPGARVRHLQAQLMALRAGSTPEGARRALHLADVHRVRTLLTCYRVSTLVRILPALVLTTLLDALVLLGRGRPGDAGSALAAPVRACGGARRLAEDRRRIQGLRRFRDAQIRRLQTRSNVRLRSLLRAGGGGLAPLASLAALGADEATAMATRGQPAAEAPLVDPTAWEGDGSSGGEPSGGGADQPGEQEGEAEGEVRIRAAHATAGSGTLTAEGSPASGLVVPAQPVVASRHLSWRWPLGAGLVLLVVFLVGGRELFGHTLPAVGSLPQTQGGPGSWWHLWWSGWRPDGLGSDASPPPALWLLAVAGTLLGGAAGTLQHVLVLGPLVVGAWGAWRTARHFGSRPGRVAALVVYAMVAVPFDALARGRWAGLVLYAAAPWLVSGLARATGAEPFGSPDRRGQQLAALRLGLLVTLVGAFAPAVLGLLVPVVAVGVIGGLVVTGEGGRSRRVLLVAVAATVVAIVLLLPWSARTVSSATALFGVGGGAAGRLGLGQLLRFDTGPVGGSVLGWGFLVAAALPLVIGRSWRLAWAGRFWVLAIWCCGIDWAGSRGWLPVSFGDPDVLLALAAAALAFSACLGVVAFDTDLPGYRFGWRQLISGVAAVAVVVGALPALAGATDGRWHLPSADANAALLLPAPATGDYRVLWVGDPAGIPAGSWRLEDGVGYATSTNGEPTVTESWPPVSSGATPLLAADLRLARGQDTTRLGHLLAPMAVRYIVVPNHNAPSGSDAAALAVPNDVLQGLSRQTDLQVQTPDPNYSVYVNTAWSPGTALLGPAAAQVARSSGGQPAAGRPQRIDEQTQQTQLRGTRALAGGLTSNTHGSVPSGSSLYVAASRSGRWSLRVGGRDQSPATAFGWAMIFRTGAGGSASLAVSTPALSVAERVVEMLLWAALVVGLIAAAARRRRARATVPISAEAPADARRPVSAGAAGLAGDEVWNDA